MSIWGNLVGAIVPVDLIKSALSKKGGDMEGPINMNGQALSGLNAPTEDTDAANKQYVDANSGDITIDMEGAEEGEANGINADTLGGQLPEYYATKEEVETRISMKLLWENPNPTNVFTAQTITLINNDCEWFLISSVNTSGRRQGTFLIKPGENGILNAIYAVGGIQDNKPSGALMINQRVCEVVSQTSIKFGGNYHNSGGTSTTWTELNTNNIPFCVFGIKGVT